MLLGSFPKAFSCVFVRVCCNAQEFRSWWEGAESKSHTSRGLCCSGTIYVYVRMEESSGCARNWENTVMPMVALCFWSPGLIWEGKIWLDLQLKLVCSSFLISLSEGPRVGQQKNNFPKRKKWKLFTFSYSFAVGMGGLFSFIVVSNSNNNQVSAQGRKNLPPKSLYAVTAEWRMRHLIFEALLNFGGTQAL